LLLSPVRPELRASIPIERELLARLGSGSAPSRIIGVEHEYRVLREDDVVDFRQVVGTLDLRAVGTDPSDPNARHLLNGLMITADGREAEVATPPVAVGPDCTWQAAQWTSLGASTLRGCLGPTASLDGYSTHINVSVDVDPVHVAWLFARRFALPAMLLMDQLDSPGLLVRPRPTRLEIGGEFIAGQQLRSALAFSIAAAAACCGAVAARSSRGLPRSPRGDITAAVERPGWYVDRRAFGPDLYRDGREAIVTQDGVSTRAGDVLASAWEGIREQALQAVSPAEVAVVDEIVDGRQPIPLESASHSDTGPIASDSPFARLHDRVANGVSVRAIALTWHSVNFELRRGTETGYVVVPRTWLGSFLDRLDQGALDDLLPRICAVADGRRCQGASGPSVHARRPDDRLLIAPEPSSPGRWRRWWPEAASVAAGAGVGFLVHWCGWW
jgi:hypothetical protein